MEVTVGIPFYNGKKYIKRAINSILKTSYKGKYEILMVDDGSTDPSLKIIKELNSNKVRVIRHKNNLGTPVARNTIANNAKSKFIVFLDVDDEMLPDRINLQIDAIKQKEKEVGHDNILCYGQIIKRFMDGSTVLFKNGFPKYVLNKNKRVLVIQGSCNLALRKKYSLK